MTTARSRVEQSRGPEGSTAEADGGIEQASAKAQMQPSNGNTQMLNQSHTSAVTSTGVTVNATVKVVDDSEQSQTSALQSSIVDSTNKESSAVSSEVVLNGTKGQKTKSSKRRFLVCRDQSSKPTDHSLDSQGLDFKAISDIPSRTSMEDEKSEDSEVNEEGWAFTNTSFYHDEEMPPCRRTDKGATHALVKHQETKTVSSSPQVTVTSPAAAQSDPVKMTEVMTTNKIKPDIYQSDKDNGASDMVENPASSKLSKMESKEDIFKTDNSRTEPLDHNRIPLKPDSKRTSSVIPSIIMREEVQTNNDRTSSVSIKSSSFQMRITRMLLLIVALFLLSYFPLAVYTFIFTFKPSLYSNEVYMWFTSLWHINTCINPFVYFYFYREYRHHVMKKSKVSPI